MKAMTALLGAAIVLGLCVDEAASQRRRRRGSVRYSRPDGTHSRNTRWGGSVTSTQRTEGNRRTTQNTATTRSGETVTGTRNVEREDDTVTVRDRDSMEQQRMPIAELQTWLADQLG